MATLLVAVGILIGPAAGAANAQSSDPCAIENFITGDEVDLTAYAACVEAQNAEGSNALARTGSDTGLYVGFGTALVALGSAAVWTSRRQRAHSNA
jgi:hypothetical protein